VSELARLETRGLGKVYERVTALAGVDLVAEPGEIVALIGPSGCGKSTLFRILAGLEEPTTGEVLIAGSAGRRLGACAFMPQHDALLPWRRTLDNVTVGLEVAGTRRAEARERARPLLERFGLGEFARAWPWQLSGGMRQRAAFLRTILPGRGALLLDEPFGALDGITRTHAQRWLLEVLAAHPATVALITHDVAEAVFVADRVLVMTPRPGRIAHALRIDLPRPRELALQETPEFALLERELRAQLRAQM
jgi:ABC-type nitrate/sulfonate/bicarbonate transport system ATPase subunit